MLNSSTSAANSRRDFILNVSAATIGTALIAGSSAAEDVEKPLVVGVMGLSRGRELAREFSLHPNVRIKYLCDTDQVRVDSALQGWKAETVPKPIATKTWTDILDDDEVDILICAAPNHWHGPATILACAAGKHVYVEKPCSHNPQEGFWMIDAAKRHKRCVQVGTQRRSSPKTREAIKKLHDGVIGRVYQARAYYNNQRGPIGRAEPTEPPDTLLYDLWQGPAPRVPFRSNVVHYNWHWFWHWGGGELANNGVHLLDICRWGLGVSLPEAVVSGGGRYAYQDDQETPDTQTVAWDFADRRQITWQALSCNKHGSAFIEFYGDNGSMEVDGDGGYKIYGRDNKLTEEASGSGVGQLEHVKNFLEAVRADDASLLNCSIEIANPSTMLCHYGNISQRTGLRVTIDPQTGHINGESPSELWQRAYADGWLDKLKAAIG